MTTAIPDQPADQTVTRGLKFTMELKTGRTVVDYRDIASVLRELADELDDPHNGSPKISETDRGQLYEDSIGIRNRTTIGAWQISPQDDDQPE